MGHPGLSARVAILSLGLLALAGCEQRAATTPDPWPPEQPTVVLCPDDPRCGFERQSEAPVTSCRLTSTRHIFKCGERPPYLRCPGPGCPTGQPSIPSQKCWISETLVDAKCTGGGGEPVADGAAPAAASPAPVQAAG